MTAAAEPRALRRAAFDFVRYGSVWEDADVLCDALAPVAAGGRLLSVASAGDNVLALLTLDPAEVVAVDISPAQLACLELRLAAFRRLDDPALLAFLGVTPATDRLTTYTSLRPALTEPSRAFWDSHPALIGRGIVHAGKFERFLRAFRRAVLPLVHPERKIRRLRGITDPAEREAFYRREWDTPRWRLLFRLVVNRLVLGRLARDPAFFAHVPGPVSAPVLERTRYALTRLPTHTNPYLAYILTGGYPPEARPRYLRPEWTRIIRERLERVRWVAGTVGGGLPGRFSGFNLSDIFEYMSPAEHESCYGELLRHAVPGARVVYWNLLAPRGRPASLESRVRPLAELSKELHARDHAWFYGALHVDEVV